MIKTMERIGYTFKNRKFMLQKNFQVERIYNWDVYETFTDSKGEFAKHLDSFITLKEAENYLKEIEKGEVNEI